MAERFFAFMNAVSNVFFYEKSLEALSKLDFRDCWQIRYGTGLRQIRIISSWQNILSLEHTFLENVKKFKPIYHCETYSQSEASWEISLKAE